MHAAGSFQNASLLVPENAVLGQSSVVTCELHTSLPVSITSLVVQWMHRGNPFSGTGVFELKQGSGTGASVYVTELILSETTVESSGLYSCRVSRIDREEQQITAETNFTVACE